MVWFRSNKRNLNFLMCHVVMTWLTRSKTFFHLTGGDQHPYQHDQIFVWRTTITGKYISCFPSIYFKVLHLSYHWVFFYNKSSQMTNAVVFSGRVSFNIGVRLWWTRAGFYIGRHIMTVDASTPLICWGFEVKFLDDTFLIPSWMHFQYYMNVPVPCWPWPCLQYSVTMHEYTNYFCHCCIWGTWN